MILRTNLGLNMKKCMDNLMVIIYTNISRWRFIITQIRRVTLIADHIGSDNSSYDSSNYRIRNIFRRKFFKGNLICNILINGSHITL